MPRLERPGGIELHWAQRGEGPLVVIAPHWSGVPEVFEPLVEELSLDHRIVTYDARGTGLSSRSGPHDMETGAGDLEAMIEAAGERAVVVGISDAPNHGIRVAARRPDLAVAVIALASAPFGQRAIRETESLIASETVVNAFIEQIETDYRGALRSMLTAANPQLDEAELRERVARQVEYCPREVGVERLRAWASDDAIEEGRAVGERYWMLYSDDTARPWFPSVSEMLKLMRRLLPDAHTEAVPDGIVSRPDLTAEVVRKITAPLRATA
jgi:pimeloyl-ACP methyl ester carboxylesterase